MRSNTATTINEARAGAFIVSGVASRGAICHMMSAEHHLMLTPAGARMRYAL